jgi:hypothetical protein
MKTSLKTWLVVAAAAGSMALTGCVAMVAAGAGAGAVAYVQGKLEAPLDAHYAKAVRAVDRAIEQLEFARISEKKDALTAIFVARTAEDKKVTIRVSKVGDQSSRVEIRVGLFGDETLSMTILDRIKTNL